MGLFDSNSKSSASSATQGNQAGKDALNLNVSAGDDQNSDISIGDFVTDNSVHNTDNSSFTDQSDNSVTNVDNSDNSVTNVDQSDHSFTDQSDNSVTTNNTDNSVFTDNTDNSVTTNNTDNSVFTDQSDNSIVYSDFGAVEAGTSLASEALGSVIDFANDALDQVQESAASSEERGLNSVLGLSEKVIYAIAFMFAAGALAVAWRK